MCHAASHTDMRPRPGERGTPQALGESIHRAARFFCECSVSLIYLISLSLENQRYFFF